MGIGAFFDFDPSKHDPNLAQASLDGALEINEFQRSFFAGTDINGNRIATSEPKTTTKTTVTLSLSFDSATKILSFLEDGTTLLSIDTDDAASDWGMTDTDHFLLAIGAFSENEGVPANTPLTLR